MTFAVDVSRFQSRSHIAHFDHQEIIVEALHLGHIETQNASYSDVAKPLIRLPLPQVVFAETMDFDRDITGFGLASGYQYDTVFSRA